MTTNFKELFAALKSIDTWDLWQFAVHFFKTKNQPQLIDEEKNTWDKQALILMIVVAFLNNKVKINYISADQEEEILHMQKEYGWFNHPRYSRVFLTLSDQGRSELEDSWPQVIERQEHIDSDPEYRDSDDDPIEVFHDSLDVIFGYELVKLELNVRKENLKKYKARKSPYDHLPISKLIDMITSQFTHFPNMVEFTNDESFRRVYVEILMHYYEITSYKYDHIKDKAPDYKLVLQTLQTMKKSELLNFAKNLTWKRDVFQDGTLQPRKRHLVLMIATYFSSSKIVVIFINKQMEASIYKNRKKSCQQLNTPRCSHIYSIVNPNHYKDVLKSNLTDLVTQFHLYETVKKSIRVSENPDEANEDYNYIGAVTDTHGLEANYLELYISTRAKNIKQLATPKSPYTKFSTEILQEMVTEMFPKFQIQKKNAEHYRYLYLEIIKQNTGWWRYFFNPSKNHSLKDLDKYLNQVGLGFYNLEGFHNGYIDRLFQYLYEKLSVFGNRLCQTSNDPHFEYIFNPSRMRGFLTTTDIQECRAKKKRFIVSELTYQFSKVGHQNVLLFDLHKRTLERFEPHGEGSENEIMDKALTEYARNIGNKWKYIDPLSFCPKLGPQSVSEDEIGLCVLFSCMYAHLRLLFPDESQSAIVDAMTFSDDGDKKAGTWKRIAQYTMLVKHIVGDINLQ